jgi:aerobic-type carbon monoxide dehydrogenase small subunit (CoxS/CutS family)
MQKHNLNDQHDEALMAAYTPLLRLLADGLQRIDSSYSCRIAFAGACITGRRQTGTQLASSC